MTVVGKPGYHETAMGWIPNDWAVMTLGDVAEVNPSRTKPENEVADITFLSMADVSEVGSILRRQTRTYLDVAKGFTSFSENDILVAKITPCFENGKGALATGLVGGLGFGSTEFHVIRASHGYADSGFIYCHTRSDLFRNLGEKQMVGSAGQKRVPTNFIRQYPVALPPLPEQQKIAAILTTVDDKLDVIARQIATTQTLKQGLMQTLFSRGVGTQDADGRWVPHSEFTCNDWGSMPASWTMGTVGEVCNVRGGKRLPKGESLISENTGFPYIRVTDMYMGGVDTKGILFVPKHLQAGIARYTISKSDIFITVAGTLGLIGKIPDELDGANLTENADKLTDITINRDYLFYTLCSDAIQDAIKKESTANAQPKLALTRIRDFEFPLPPDEEQAQIAIILASVDTKLSKLSAKQTLYKSLRRGLMQKLLTGEWRVKCNVLVIESASTGLSTTNVKASVKTISSLMEEAL